MNLATARSAERAREVGVRKVMALSESVITQFLTEAVLLSTISTIIAIAGVFYCCPISII